MAMDSLGVSSLSVPLANLFAELGYNSCSSITTCSNLLSQVNAMRPIEAKDVAQTLGMMAQTSTISELPLLSDGSSKEEALSSWNVEVFLESVRKLRPKLNLQQVFAELDYEGLKINDAAGFDIFASAAKHLGLSRFPVSVLLSRWTHQQSQLSLLRAAFTTAPELFNPANDPSLHSVCIVETRDQTIDLSRNLLAVDTTPPWICRELIQVLVNMHGTPEAEGAKELLELGIKTHIEVILFGLVQILNVHPDNGIAREIAGGILQYYLLQAPGIEGAVLARVWHLNRDLVIQAMADAHRHEPSVASRFLDFANEINGYLSFPAKGFLDEPFEHKVLPQILDSSAAYFSLAIDLASLAFRREYLNLEKWLQDHIQQHRTVFIKMCLDALQQKVNSPEKNVPLSLETVATFLKTLMNNTSLMTPELLDQFKQIQAAYLQSYPKLSSTLADPSKTGMEAPFSQEVEDDANSYFQKIYTSQLSIEEIIALLQRFKTSTNQREQEIFLCMIHNLFDEYRFFPKYPEKELMITGVLFGSLIQHQLVSYIPLGIALRYVLEALRKPYQSKMFRFGVKALRQFALRLGEWPQYCSHILQIYHLRQQHAEIVSYIERVLADPHTGNAIPDVDDPNTAAAAVVRSTVASVLPSFEGSVAPVGMTPPVSPSRLARTTSAAAAPPSSTASASLNTLTAGGTLARTMSSTADLASKNSLATLNINTLLDAATVPYKAPNEAVEDRISFIFNNVSASNVEEKAQQVLELVSSEFYDWLAQYIVVKRASIEPNFHNLYILVLDTLKQADLDQRVLLETYTNVRILLNSEKTLNSSSERSLLKNLGTWLGSITLARNKPILQKHLGMKEVLVSTYENNRLLVSIPFVCKVLDQAARSKIFRPPNPWTMAIVRLLVELYQHADLKLNLKFEIEVLCKSLKVELKDIEPTSILKNRASRAPSSSVPVPLLALAPPSLSSSSSSTAAAQPNALTVANAAAAAAASSSSNTSNTASAVPAAVSAPAPVPPSASSVALSAQSAPTTPQPMADDKYGQLGASFAHQQPQALIALQHPLIKRFVPIATESAIRDILQAVVERSAKIACIAARDMIVKDFAMEADELKMRKAAHAMVQHLASALALVACKDPFRLSVSNHLRGLFSSATSDPALLEQAIHVACSEANVELASNVMEKAAAEKGTREIDEELASAFAARKRAREKGQPFYDVSVFPSRYAALLPDALRQRSTGLAHYQLRVYDDFSRALRPPAPATPSAGVSEVPAAAVIAKDNTNLGVVTTQYCIEKFLQYVLEIERIAAPVANDVQTFSRQALQIINSAQAKEDAANAVALRALLVLFEHNSDAARELCVAVLDRLAESSKRFAKDLSIYALRYFEEGKYNVGAALALTRHRLVSLTELVRMAERKLHTVASSNNVNTLSLDFIIKVLQSYLGDDGSEASRTLVESDLAGAIDALARSARLYSAAAADELARLVVKTRSRIVYMPLQPLVPTKAEDSDPRVQTMALFDEWILCTVDPLVGEKTHQAFVAKLFQPTGVLSSDDNAAIFFRACIERCISDHVLAVQNIYQSIDALARLISMLVKWQPEIVPANLPQRTQATSLQLLNRILAIVVIIMTNLSTKQNFPQKVFFRLFINLFNDLTMPDKNLDPIAVPILVTLADAMHALRPAKFPSFAFAWLDLVSHRMFMPKLLFIKNQKAWPLFQRLLIDLFKFLVPYLRNAEMNEPIRHLYRGTLRVLLVLLHDFPEFLCDYHFVFCDVIPPSCIQLRNLILSAFPRNMRLPDPFTPNLKVDLLPEINQSPRILGTINKSLTANGFLPMIDMYLKTRSPVSFLIDLRSKLLLPQRDVAAAGTKYNVLVINALVLYVGIQAIAQLQSKTPNQSSPITHSAPMDVFQQLVVDLDTEGRYLFLNAIANQLRYPNSHTHYFSCVLLYLFAEANQEIIQEQITRILLERLIVNRPHPWGLLITFIELIKNPRYTFWSHSFTRCAPEIERLFESVARSCMVPAQKGGAISDDASANSATSQQTA